MTHPILGELYRGGGFAGGRVMLLRCVDRKPNYWVLRSDTERFAIGRLVDLDACQSPLGFYERHVPGSFFTGSMRDYEHVPLEIPEHLWRCPRCCAFYRLLVAAYLPDRDLWSVVHEAAEPVPLNVPTCRRCGGMFELFVAATGDDAGAAHDAELGQEHLCDRCGVTSCGTRGCTCLDVLCPHGRHNLRGARELAS